MALADVMTKAGGGAAAGAAAAAPGELTIPGALRFLAAEVKRGLEKTVSALGDEAVRFFREVLRRLREKKQTVEDSATFGALGALALARLRRRLER